VFVPSVNNNPALKLQRHETLKGANVMPKQRKSIRKKQKQTGHPGSQRTYGYLENPGQKWGGVNTALKGTVGTSSDGKGRD